MTMIDIHPHVISTDTARHPLMPLGGTRSNWSRDRPTSFAKLAEAMDAAGIDKAAVVRTTLQCLDADDHEWIFGKTAQTLYPILNG
ncbi:MAG: hypothetical protein J2P54_17340 [Bradyrhizobiaceae bacterium]|nr:hypothetical protein [Bradyrhizobiaceae bacterium]